MDPSVPPDPNGEAAHPPEQLRFPSNTAATPKSPPSLADLSPAQPGIPNEPGIMAPALLNGIEDSSSLLLRDALPQTPAPTASLPPSSTTTNPTGASALLSSKVVAGPFAHVVQPPMTQNTEPLPSHFPATPSVEVQPPVSVIGEGLDREPHGHRTVSVIHHDNHNGLPESKTGPSPSLSNDDRNYNGNGNGNGPVEMSAMSRPLSGPHQPASVPPTTDPPLLSSPVPPTNSSDPTHATINPPETMGIDSAQTPKLQEQHSMNIRPAFHQPPPGQPDPPSQAPPPQDQEQHGQLPQQQLVATQMNPKSYQASQNPYSQAQQPTPPLPMHHGGPSHPQPHLPSSSPEPSLSMHQQQPPNHGHGQGPTHFQMQPHLQQQHHQLQQHGPPHHEQPQPNAGALTQQGPPKAPAGPPPHQQQPPQFSQAMRGLRVEDALLYLDDVKREFRGRPHVYNEFLGIMKNFKSQEVDTPGVIARVSKLFRGYNKLILGFNTFLPEGYKISLADLERQEAELRKLEAMPQAQFRQGPPPANSENGPSPASPGPPPQHPTSQQHPQPAWSQSSESAPAPSKAKGNGPTHPKKKKGPRSLPTKKAAAAAALPPPPPPPPPENQNQTVEFDHAISYVTTIKKRFVHDPSTYHQFLEILHTYQKEQRGIKEVLEQVAHLFQDHPDLLKEFTFFLPDAVQEQAKERLHRAAAESETRLAAQRQQQLEQYHVDTNVKSPANAVNRQPKFIDMTHASQAAALAPGPEPQRKHPLEGAPPASAMADQSESYVYNAAVERQFFDAAREAMSFSRDGGQAWAEFLKCLDMYAQEILTRTEMLTFVEQILGKRNAKLLEEFKRILASAGSPDGPAPLLEDSWYSVPLSEIDFSRCRRCTPSYRALPRDYPAPPCGDRSDEEAKVLNDIWVSLPVGSEESYTFRHMRRNTYEETLFRVEDERFEIDMVIDSNAATLKRLEPIAEEVAMLAQEELMPPDTGKAISDGTGLSGRRFQFTFDKSILGVIHRNSIKRIYGDSGREMLDLLVKNPTVAIPVVIERLRQKDREWRTVRKRMNRHWKELAENNYYKSLDHRGLTWRTIDKRATSTRTLISEIKDRASNKGREGKEALRQRLDKAKEEHGSFYEVTKGQYLSEDLDLTFLPKPDRRIFTPHLGHVYENNAWVQRDVYRILAFALERGPITPADKERCHRLWLEFFGPFFGLSLSWMQQPAVAFQEANSTIVQIASPAVPTVVSEEDDEDSMEDDTEIAGRVITEELADSMKDGTVKNCVDYHPLPSGAHVSTLYGEGTILQFRRSENMYVVKLNFGGTGYIRPTTVLCSVLPVEKSAYTRELRINDRTKLARAGDQLVFGTQSLYLFFRLHHILVQRLNTAKKLAYSVGEDRSLITVVEQMNDPNPKTTGRRRYEAYMSLVYSLLDGGVGGAAEGGKYEDRVRGLLGHGSYELATMDKLISHIWKNLQTLSQDETMWNLVQLFRRHMDAGTFQPEAFRQEAAYLSDGEQMYAFQYCPVQGKDDAVLYAEYLGVIDDGNEGGAAMVEDAVLESVEPANKRQRR